MPLREVLEAMLGIRPAIVDADAGVRTRLTVIEIETPVELEVARDGEGRLCIGSTPPLYCLRTTVAPSYHRLRFTAHVSEDGDGRD